jgi:hypothetical protein
MFSILALTAVIGGQSLNPAAALSVAGLPAHSTFTDCSVACQLCCDTCVADCQLGCAGCLGGACAGCLASSGEKAWAKAPASKLDASASSSFSMAIDPATLAGSFVCPCGTLCLCAPCDCR